MHQFFHNMQLSLAETKPKELNDLKEGMLILFDRSKKWLQQFCLY